MFQPMTQLLKNLMIVIIYHILNGAFEGVVAYS